MLSLTVLILANLPVSHAVLYSFDPGKCKYCRDLLLRIMAETRMAYLSQGSGVNLCVRTPGKIGRRAHLGWCACLYKFASKLIV